MAAAYSIIGGSVIAQQQVGTHAVAFAAEDVRRERTGIHARLRIMLDMTTLSWSTLNVERDEDRVRLVNAAWKHIAKAEAVRMSPFPDDYDQGVFKYDFDQFCEGLWNAKVGADLACPVAGATVHRPPKRIAGSFLIDGGGTLYFGPPEQGKSWTLMTMAVCIDAGLSHIWQVEQRPVLFINLERSQTSIENRLGAINRALGLPADRPLVMMNRRGYSLADVYSAAERSVQQIGPNCVVMLDSITRAGAGDLIKNEVGNQIIDMMNRLAPTWMGIAHTPRSDQTHVYGSFMFDAGADILVRGYSELRGDERGVGLITDKSNDLPKMARPEVVAYRFGQNDDGLLGIRAGKLGEFPEMLIASSNESREESLFKHVLRIGETTATDASKETGIERSVVARIFAESDRFVRVRQAGREVYYGVAAHA